MCWHFATLKCFVAIFSKTKTLSLKIKNKCSTSCAQDVCKGQGYKLTINWDFLKIPDKGGQQQQQPVRNFELIVLLVMKKELFALWRAARVSFRVPWSCSSDRANVCTKSDFAFHILGRCQVHYGGIIITQWWTRSLQSTGKCILASHADIFQFRPRPAPLHIWADFQLLLGLKSQVFRIASSSRRDDNLHSESAGEKKCRCPLSIYSQADNIQPGSTSKWGVLEY